MTLPDDWLNQLKSLYPRRDGGQGWSELKRLVPRAIANGATFDELLRGAIAYRTHCDKKGHTGTDFTMMAQTFFGRGEWWIEYAEIATSQRAESLKARARALGFGTVSDELLADLDALEAKLTGIARQREEAQRLRDQSERRNAVVAEIGKQVRA